MVTRGVVRHWGERKEGRKGEKEDGRRGQNQCLH